MNLRTIVFGAPSRAASSGSKKRGIRVLTRVSTTTRRCSDVPSNHEDVFDEDVFDEDDEEDSRPGETNTVNIRFGRVAIVPPSPQSALSIDSVRARQRDSSIEQQPDVVRVPQSKKPSRGPWDWRVIVSKDVLVDSLARKSSVAEDYLSTGW